jgi:hypothetical protein
MNDPFSGDLFVHQVLPCLWWNEIATTIQAVCRSWNAQCRALCKKTYLQNDGAQKKTRFALRITGSDDFHWDMTTHLPPGMIWRVEWDSSNNAWIERGLKDTLWLKHVRAAKIRHLPLQDLIVLIQRIALETLELEDVRFPLGSIHQTLLDVMPNTARMPATLKSLCILGSNDAEDIAIVIREFTWPQLVSIEFEMYHHWSRNRMRLPLPYIDWIRTMCPACTRLVSNAECVSTTRDSYVLPRITSVSVPGLTLDKATRLFPHAINYACAFNVNLLRIDIDHSYQAPLVRRMGMDVEGSSFTSNSNNPLWLSNFVRIGKIFSSVTSLSIKHHAVVDPNTEQQDLCDEEDTDEFPEQQEQQQQPAASTQEIADAHIQEVVPDDATLDDLGLDWLQGMSSFAHVTELHLDLTDWRELYVALEHCNDALISLTLMLPHDLPSCVHLMSLIARRFPHLVCLRIKDYPLPHNHLLSNYNPLKSDDQRVHHYMLRQLEQGEYFQKLRTLELPTSPYTQAVHFVGVEAMIRRFQGSVLDARNTVWRRIRDCVPETITPKSWRLPSTACFQHIAMVRVSLLAQTKCWEELCSETLLYSSESNTRETWSVLDMHIHVLPGEPSMGMFERMFGGNQYCHAATSPPTLFVHVTIPGDTAGFGINDLSVTVIYNVPLSVDVVRACGWPDAILDYLATYPLVSLPTALALGAISVHMFRSLCGVLQTNDMPAKYLVIRHPLDNHQAFLLDVHQVTQPLGDMSPTSPSTWPAWALDQLHSMHPVDLLLVS